MLGPQVASYNMLVCELFLFLSSLMISNRSVGVQAEFCLVHAFQLVNAHLCCIEMSVCMNCITMHLCCICVSVELNFRLFMCVGVVPSVYQSSNHFFVSTALTGVLQNYSIWRLKVQ